MKFWMILMNVKYISPILWNTYILTLSNYKVGRKEIYYCGNLVNANDPIANLVILRSTTTKQLLYQFEWFSTNN